MRKVANILLVIYVIVICALFILFACAFNDSGEPFEKIVLAVVLSLLIPCLCIYTITHLIYDIYKQFALWKIVGIVLLAMFLYIICSLNVKLF